jgi:hypothetical protein
MYSLCCNILYMLEISRVIKIIGVKMLQFLISVKGKGKSVPLQAWKGPEGSRKLRLPDFVTTTQYGGRLSALRTGRLYPPGNTPGTHFY